MLSVLESILPIFLIALLGSIIKRKWLTAEEFWRGIEKLLYFFLFPVALINYIANANLNITALIKLIASVVISTLIITVGLVAYQYYNNFNKATFTSIFQGSTRYNSYMFLSLTGALYGEQGLAIGAAISAYIIIFTNILSVVIFNVYLSEAYSAESYRKYNILLPIKNLCSNPLIIASLCGMLLNYGEVQMTLGIKQTLQTLSGAALPIGCLNIGANLKLNTNNIDCINIAVPITLKLVILPIITIVILNLMHINNMAKAIGILCSGLPCSSTAYVLSRQLGGDSESMAAIITFSTICSIASLPLLIYIFA